MVITFEHNQILQRNYGSSVSSKVIDHDIIRKFICNFSLVITSNFGRISYCFQDIEA